jgi:SAM-dependent methyltransferase
MDNINDHFFEGQYKELWRTMIPEILTQREVDFMIPYFGLKEGSRVLDLMCGYGRHALALGRKGVAVVAVDNLADYTREINQKAGEENLPVKAINSSVKDFVPDALFNLAICMGNSFNFFNAHDVQTILNHTAGALEKGGSLLINSWSIAEIVFQHFKSSADTTVGDTRMTSTLELKFHPTRLEAVTVFTSPDGATETKTGIDYIYSLNEMNIFFSAAGLKVRELFSIPGKKPFAPGEPRIYIVADKI